MTVRQPARDSGAAPQPGQVAPPGNPPAASAEPSAGILGPSIAVGVVFALAGALAGLASSDDPPDAAARRREIASMSQAERDRLERNYERFLDLSEPDRQRLRHLGAVVRRDPALEQTLRDYTAWLDNLSPWQRQEVASSEDPDVQVAVIRRILADQKRQHDEYEREQQRLAELFEKHRERNVVKFSGRPGFPEWERLKPTELAAALDPLEDALPADSQLAPMPADGHCAENRNLEILSAALKHYSARPDFHDEPIPRSVLAAVVAALPEGRRQRFYEEQLDKPYGPRFLTLMFVKIASENWWDEARRDRRMPRSRAEIEALAAKLSPESQSEFARLESQSSEKAFEAYSRLLRAYYDLWFEEKEAEFNRHFAELRDVIKKLDYRGPFPDPFGGRTPPGGWGTGSRGGSDDDRRGYGRGPSERGRDFHRRDGRDDHRDGRDGRDEPGAPQEPDEPARAE